MKNEHRMDYYFGKASRAMQGLGLALLLTLLLLLASCGESSTTNSSPTPASAPTRQAPTSTPTAQAAVGTPTDSNLSLSQAQKQAGYHLLSIPSSLAGYTLTRVNVFGASAVKVYSLYYSTGKNTITLVENQPLGNRVGSSKVSLRGTTGTLSTSNGITTLSWVEKGVSMLITGPLSSTQMLALAKSLV